MQKHIKVKKVRNRISEHKLESDISEKISDTSEINPEKEKSIFLIQQYLFLKINEHDIDEYTS